MWKMKSEKRLARIERNVNDTAPEELRLALEDAGFVLGSITASHWIYWHPARPQNLSVPYRRPLKPVCVRLALQAITEVTNEG